MRKTLPFLLLICFISCSDPGVDELESSHDLKKRLVLLKSSSSFGRYVSDSIVEYYENKQISRSEYYRRYRSQEVIEPWRSFFIQYEYSPSGMLAQYKLFNDSEYTDQFAANTYHYNANNSIQRIEYEKVKPSQISERLSKNTRYYEYIADTVKTYLIDHLDDQGRESESTYVISANADSIIRLESNYLHLFDAQRDLVTTKYLGDPADVWSWQHDISYGDDRVPLMGNFFGNRLNLFLIPDPVKYYFLEQTSKYRTSEFIHTHRTNETIRYEYTSNADNLLPMEMRRAGTFYSGDVIRYFYE